MSSKELTKSQKDHHGSLKIINPHWRYKLTSLNSIVDSFGGKDPITFKSFENG